MFNPSRNGLPMCRCAGVTVGGGTASGANRRVDLSGPVERGRQSKISPQSAGLGRQQLYPQCSRQRNQYAGLALDFQLTDQTVLESNFSYYHFIKGLPALCPSQRQSRFRRRWIRQTKANMASTTPPATTTPPQPGSLHIKHDFDGNWLLDIGVLRQIADRESTAVTQYAHRQSRPLHHHNRQLCRQPFYHQQPLPIYRQRRDGLAAA